MRTDLYWKNYSEGSNNSLFLVQGHINLIISYGKNLKYAFVLFTPTLLQL